MILDRRSQIFFVCFFAAIALSVAAIFFNIVVKRNYNTFTEDDEIPEPTQIYADAFGVIKSFLH